MGARKLRAPHVAPNAAMAWYRELRLVMPRCGGYTIFLISQTVMQATLTFAQRTAILVGLADFQNATVTCPWCAAHGPHSSDQHHRFARLTFTCRSCASNFKATDVQ